MNFTRREILTAFLGLPIALAACKSTAEYNLRNSIEGEIIGQNVDLGHILRERRSFEVPVDNWETIDVAIVGAGISGLTAAWKLKKENFDNFVVFELEKEAGGTARSGKNSFISYPWGAHYLPVPFQENKELIGFLDELNLVEGRDKTGEVVIKEQFLCREPEERIFYKGRWYEGLYLHVGASAEDKRQFDEFQKLVDFYVNWRDKSGIRAFVVPVENCSRDREILQLDELNFGEFLRSKGFTSERLFWYCDYACRDDYGLKLDQTSAWAGMFYFCSRVRKSGVESQPFITFPEGNGKYSHYFRDVLGDKIRPNSAVVKIIPGQNGVGVIYLHENQIRGIHAKKVIFASPIFTAKYVIENFDEHVSQDFQHNAWFVANLTLKNRPKAPFKKDFPLAWDNVFYDSPSLGYVVSTHQNGMDYGETVFTYYYPMCAEENARAKLFALNWEQIADIILTDISFVHKDIRELTTRIDVMRWGHAMISPRPNFMWSEAREIAAKPFKNVHFAHSDLSGIALFEHAFYHGSRAASEIIRSSRQD